MIARRIIDILITVAFVIGFFVSIDITVFHNSYYDRVAFLECQKGGKEISVSYNRDCCEDYCYYHAGTADSEVAKVWESTVSTALTYIFYPFISPFIK